MAVCFSTRLASMPRFTVPKAALLPGNLDLEAAVGKNPRRSAVSEICNKHVTVKVTEITFPPVLIEVLAKDLGIALLSRY